MKFSVRLKEIRKEKNVKQKDLAKYLGLSANCICEWEKGRSQPSLEDLEKLCKYFYVSSDYLLGLSDY